MAKSADLEYPRIFGLYHGETYPSRRFSVKIFHDPQTFGRFPHLPGVPDTWRHLRRTSPCFRAVSGRRPDTAQCAWEQGSFDILNKGGRWSSASQQNRFSPGLRGVSFTPPLDARHPKREPDRKRSGSLPVLCLRDVRRITALREWAPGRPQQAPGREPTPQQRCGRPSGPCRQGSACR